MAHMRFSQNQRSNPAWAAEMLDADDLLPAGVRLDPTQFVDQGGLLVTVGAAGAAGGATSIPVTITSPLANFIAVAIGTNPWIPAGTTLDFGGAKVARTTADAYYGDTAIAVAALPTALVSGDVARYTRTNTIFVPSGTLIGRSVAQRAANAPWGPGDVVTPHIEIYLTAFDVVDARLFPDTVAVRHQVAIKENYLPNYAALTAGQLAWIRANYHHVTGQD